MSAVTVTTPRSGVAQVTMSRPAIFNAFDEAMIGELDAAVAQVEADPAARVLLLVGEGKHFSAGADLKWMERAATASVEWNLADARRFAAMLSRLANCAKPTVARVQGAALGGGVGLACVCDIAIAGERASFAVSEAKFGILPAVIGPYVVNAVGRRAAQWLALTTTRIDARRACELGLVQQVVADAELDAAVNKVLDELLAGSPNAQREIKLMLGQLGVAEVTAEVRELTAQTISRVRGTAEAREGFDAFLNKRAPKWTQA